MKFVLIIFVSSMFGSIFPIASKAYSSLDGIEMESKLDNKSVSKTFTSMALSAILPGAGQYYLGAKTPAYIFIGIEAILLGTKLSLESEVNHKREQFREYANDHWSFSYWIQNYEYWRNNLEHWDAFNGYPQIWEDNHSINFNSGGNYYSSSGPEFQNFIYDLNLCSYSSSNDCLNQLTDQIVFYAPNDGVIKDHNFYENIGKYSHFFAGWDDATSGFYAYKKPGSGEILAYSENKKKYWDLFEDADQVSKIVNYSLSAILVNHVSSIFHALLISKPNVNSNKFLISTILDLNNKYGVGGVNIHIRW